MSQDTLRDQLARLVISRSRLKLEQVRDDDTLNFELGYDSHAMLNLLLDIEDAFGIEVPPERVPELVGQRFGNLLEMVRQFQTAREPAS
jgi:acyl carrier protein